MEDRAMEEVRTRLAVATRAATAVAKSLEALDENTLQSLQKWIASQEGEVKCGRCLAPMPRGKEACVCIACGSSRPPSHNTLEFNFKVSCAFLQFLETIHPPIKVSGSRKATSILSTASESAVPSQSVEDRVEAAETDMEDVETLRETLSAERSLPPASLQETTPHDDNRVADTEVDTEIDDYGDFQETGTDFINERAEINTNPDASDANEHCLSDETINGREESANGTSEAVSNWDTDWNNPSVHITSKVRPEGNGTAESSEVSRKEASSAPHMPDYDLSFFEAFGGSNLKEEKSSAVIDAIDFFRDSPAKTNVITRLANAKSMERFASDTSAFTTLTDGDSDSGDSSFEAFPPPKPPLDILLEVGGSGREDDLLGPLEYFDGVGDFPMKAAATDPLSTAAISLDPFSWSLEAIVPASSNVIEDDFFAASDTFAANSAASIKIGVDPFPWPLEELDQPIINSHEGKLQELPNFEASDPSGSKLNGIDPFPWPLEGFDQQTHALQKGVGTTMETAPQVEVSNNMGPDADDWGDEEFVWSQAEPAGQPQHMLYVDKLFPTSSESSLLRMEFQSTNSSVDVSIAKDEFLLDQIAPNPSHTSFSRSSAGNVADLVLESLGTNTGKAPMEGDDLSRVTHVRSVSFGESEKKSPRTDQIEDLFKRSVSVGNLEVDSDAQVNDLLRVLQTPSVSQPHVGEIGGDILQFLNLKPASSLSMEPPYSDLNGSSAKPTHVRSISFGTLELVPDEQSEEMFQFFHTRSLSAGSEKMVQGEDGSPSSSNKNMSERLPSMVEISHEVPAVIEDPFNFIRAAVAAPAKNSSVESEESMRKDVQDDFFEWKSAEFPTSISSQTSTQTPQPSVLTPSLTNHQDMFQWASSTSSSLPLSSTNKLPINGALSGLLSLAGGMPPSTMGQTSRDDDDFFQALSRKSPSTGGAQAVQTGSQGIVSWTHSASAPAESAQPTYDSDDEFSDFISNGALPSAPPPSATQNVASEISKPAFDVSFFEQAQPSSSEKRDSDFFSDLMGLNFTNA